MKLFEYAILYHPKPTKEQRDNGIDAPSELVADVVRVLAKDVNEVQIRAARSIPEKYLDKLSQVEIAIRPF